MPGHTIDYQFSIFLYVLELGLPKIKRDISVIRFPMMPTINGDQASDVATLRTYGDFY